MAAMPFAQKHRAHGALLHAPASRPPHDWLAFAAK